MAAVAASHTHTEGYTLSLYQYSMHAVSFCAEARRQDGVLKGKVTHVVLIEITTSCVCTSHACAFYILHICVHVCNWHEHAHRYTWEQCVDGISAIWGDCLGSTAQHIFCVSRPGEIRFMEGCGTARWGPEQWLFVCCCFIGSDNCSPSPFKDASRYTGEHAGTHMHTLTYPQECVHTPAGMCACTHKCRHMHSGLMKISTRASLQIDSNV